MVSSTPRPHFTSGKDAVPILQETVPVWTGGKFCRHRDSIPDRPDRSSVATPTEPPCPQTGPYTYLLHGAESFLEKLTGLLLIKKFPAFHGTRRFITALTSVHHLSLSWASPIQSIYPHPTSWRSILILSTHLRLCLPSGSFPPVSPPRPYTPPLPTHTRHMPSPSHSSRFYHPHNIG